MPRPRSSAPHGGSRDGSGEESDATLDPHSSSPAPTRRTRKRSAHMAREGSVEQSNLPAAFRPHTETQTSTIPADSPTLGEGSSQGRTRHTDRRSTGYPHRSASSAFESPNQARERLVLMQSVPAHAFTENAPQQGGRSARSTRHALDAHLRPAPTQEAEASSSSILGQREPSDLLTSRSRAEGSMTGRSLVDEHNAGPYTPNAGLSLQLPPQNARVALEELSRSGPLQPLASSAQLSATSMARSASNMSPPRPTRSLPRRRASARTQSRPQLTSSNSASSSYALRSRSTSNSNVLASSNSAANIMASGQANRPSLAIGCAPLGGGFDPSYTPSSGMSTPRTPLAEIPLWLADMRSQSRRSSTSSTSFSSFLERDDYLIASRSASSHHTRTLSTSSSGPSSPGATRNGSISPVIPFRRSLRGRRPRQSDENARLSPSPSYFGEYDSMPPSSAASARGEMAALDELPDADASLSSSMIHLGTTSPSTPSVQLQASSPAMSTRSRTLNRLASIRSRRLTDPLNAPITNSASDMGDARHAHRMAPSASYSQLRSSTAETPRTASLLERRAAAANVAAGPSRQGGRVTSRPGSRTSSPARGTRAARRRSNATEGQEASAGVPDLPGPMPADLPPLQIGSTRFHREVASGMAYGAALQSLHDAAGSSVLSGLSLEETAPAAVGGPAMQLEPISPSAFSEMTSLTQGSTASESVNSAGGLPATPSSSASVLDPFSHSLGPEAVSAAAASTVDAAGDAVAEAHAASVRSDRVLRQTTSQRKTPLASRRMNGDDEDALGLRFDPHP